MKKILAVLMIVVACFAGCVAAGPRPPIELPFAVHKAGATVSTELRIVEIGVHKYPLYLRFEYKERDREDRDRIRSLVEAGIPISLKLSIFNIDSSTKKLFFEKVLFVGACDGYSKNYFDRMIEQIDLRPGKYYVQVISLKDIPELENVRVIFGIYNPRTK